MTWLAIPGPRPRVRYLSPEDLPRLLGVAGKPSVVLGPEARRTIVHECMWNRGDEIESGGGLFGHVDGRTIVVSSASRPGLDAERSPSHVRFDGSEFFSFAAPECGFWHTHPRAKFAVPSDADIACWRHRLARLPSGTCHYLGLIVVKGERSWGSPEICAWTVDETTAAPQRIRVIET